MMTAVPELIVDTLNGLLEAEVNSVFRFVGDSSPFMDTAGAEMKRPMDELKKLSEIHQTQLAEMIESQGGVPRVRHRVRTEEQYLAYLSLKFLLPKLVSEKDLILTRYENAKKTIGSDFPELIENLNRIEGEQRYYLDILQQAAVQITNGKFIAPPHGTGGAAVI